MKKESENINSNENNDSDLVWEESDGSESKTYSKYFIIGIIALVTIIIILILIFVIMWVVKSRTDIFVINNSNNLSSGVDNLSNNSVINQSINFSINNNSGSGGGDGGVEDDIVGGNGDSSGEGNLPTSPVVPPIVEEINITQLNSCLEDWNFETCKDYFLQENIKETCDDTDYPDRCNLGVVMIISQEQKTIENCEQEYCVDIEDTDLKGFCEMICGFM